MSALVSFTTWAQRQDLLATNPARRLERRKATRRGDRAIPAARLDSLFTDPKHALRERLLWRLLYDTGRQSRGTPHPQRRGPRPGVPPRPRRLQGRRHRIRALGHPNSSATASPADRPHPRAGVLCPDTGRGRLSYPRAEYLFKIASAEFDPHRQGWTPHQLRHSALQHLAEAGRTAPELQAQFRHQHLASLGRYVHLGEETSARITAEADPVQRRRPR
ncbi:tyrosine-type recombinase/integrase [Nonomuraea aridisoli]|uniref:tyrosine-type recombinase/integrase n=1 Tax=Nonomuraea aridisoli TaxID=2070368 RepID=UPI001C64C638